MPESIEKQPLPPHTVKCVCGLMPKVFKVDDKFVFVCKCGRKTNGYIKVDKARKAWNRQVQDHYSSREYKDEKWRKKEERFQQEEHVERKRREYGQNPTHEVRRLNKF